MTKQERAFFELVRTYPSPHNGQPMVLRRESDSTFTIMFETDRGLSATPISHLFSFVTVGVFVRHIELCAQALGHELKLDLDLPLVADMAKPNASLSCGSVKLMWGAEGPDGRLLDAINFRQTSRKNYTKGLREGQKRSFERLAEGSRLRLSFVPDDKAGQVIWLNQRAVFDDMFDDSVRSELQKWMRTSHAEKVNKKDGLSYDCMEMSGPVLRFILKHYKVLRWPVVSTILEQYYIRTMKDNSTIGYLQSPFVTESDGYMIGRLIMDIWHKLSQDNMYLHPFGTLVSNDQAHQDFIQLMGISPEEREDNYVTFIFRAGTSAKPIASERLPLDHFIREVQGA